MSNALRINSYQRSDQLLEIANRGKQAPVAKTQDKESFQQVLSTELSGNSGVNFSKHAAQRLHSRGIEFDAARLEKISQGIDTAERKGSKETLILSDDAALVVSVKNRTVITAFDRDNLREGIVTSIDSAIIL